MTFDKTVIARDQNQKTLSQTFEELSGRMVPPRLARGSNMLKQYGSVLGRIEQAYGVPGEIIVALVDDEEATLKRFRRKGASIALEAANPAYETRIFGPDRVKIQGKLVGLIRRYH